MCNKRGISQKFTSAYNPTANGIVERINQTLGNGLRCGAGKKISTVLRHIEQGLRLGHHESIGCSPYEAAYQQNPLDLGQRTSVVTLKDINTRQYYRAAKHRERANKKRTKTPNIVVGSKVYLKIPIRGNKLDPYWSGPYEVTDTRAKNNSFRLEIRPGHFEWANLKRLRPL